MSFGSSGACDAILQDQLDQVRAQGVVLVAAAGNDASNSVQTPASCQNVINVASVGPLRTRAPYSNFGDTVDVAAPGGDMSKDVNGDGLLDGIYSTHATGGGTATVFTLELLQGTSMAAPHVSGVIALMLSRNSQLTPAEIDAHLGLGSLTDDLGDTSLGKGLINARKAIAAVDPNLPPLPPNLSVTPSSLAFGDIGTTADVVATNGGGGTLVISPPTSSEPWLSVTAKAVDGNGLGTYSVAVDRTGLQEGSYSGVVEFTSNDGTEQIEVLMEVSLVPGDPNAGEQYVLLLNPVTFENLAQVQVRADDDAVDYVFQGVAADEYIVISGTDLNNDGFICDPAEACGAYPVESQPEPIVVQGDVTGRDFVVAYRAGLTINASSTGAAKVLRPKLRPRRIDK
jgi:serine protease